jgi:hypothetical protein
VDLDDLAVAVPHARLVAAGGGGAGADDRVGALAEDQPAAAGRHDDGVGAEGRICIVRMSCATMPTQRPSSITGQRNSQNSYLVTLPSAS